MPHGSLGALRLLQFGGMYLCNLLRSSGMLFFDAPSCCEIKKYYNEMFSRSLPGFQGWKYSVSDATPAILVAVE